MAAVIFADVTMKKDMDVNIFLSMLTHFRNISQSN